MVLNHLSPPKSKTALAYELGVSRASLYYKPKLPEKDLKLKAEIEQVMADNKAYTRGNHTPVVGRDDGFVV